MTTQLPKLIVPLRIFCPYCGVRHIDASRNGEKWDRRAHTTHRCQGCSKDFDVFVSGASDDELANQNVHLNAPALVGAEPPRAEPPKTK